MRHPRFPKFLPSPLPLQAVHNAGANNVVILGAWRTRATSRSGWLCGCGTIHESQMLNLRQPGQRARFLEGNDFGGKI